MSTNRVPRIIGAGLTAVLLALSGCSGSSATSSDAGGGAAVASAPGAAARESLAADSQSKGGTTMVSAQDQKVIRTATLLLEVPDIARAAAKVRVIATGAQGVVTAEQLTSGTDVPKPEPGHEVTPTRFADGMVVISVPQSSLDRVLDQLAGVGTLMSRQLSSQDVTATFVDTKSRVASLQASVDRIRALMAKATDITDLAALEGELSRRQTDLEAMQSQLKALEDQVAMSSVTVNLATPGTTLREDTDWGFFTGLKNGLSALANAVVIGLTAIGAALPFAAVLALLAAPLLWWRRRRAARRTPPASAAEGEAASDPVAPDPAASDPAAPAPVPASSPGTPDS